MKHQKKKERKKEVRKEIGRVYISKVIAWTVCTAIVQSQYQPVSYHTQNF